MITAETIIRSYERDLKAGVAAGLIKRHAKNRVRKFARLGQEDIASQLEVWINTNL